MIFMTLTPDTGIMSTFWY